MVCKTDLVWPNSTDSLRNGGVNLWNHIVFILTCVFTYVQP